MKNDIANKIAAALLKEKRDSWTTMSDEQQEAVFCLQRDINTAAMRYIDGNTVCDDCGAPAYRVSKLAAELITFTSCSECTQVSIVDTKPVQCCCGRSLVLGEIHQCPHERQPIVAQTCVPCKSKRN